MTPSRPGHGYYRAFQTDAVNCSHVLSLSVGDGWRHSAGRLAGEGLAVMLIGTQAHSVMDISSAAEGRPSRTSVQGFGCMRIVELESLTGLRGAPFLALLSEPAPAPCGGLHHSTVLSSLRGRTSLWSTSRNHKAHSVWSGRRKDRVRITLAQ